MKHWPAIVSAAVALAVAVPVLHELVPDCRLFERTQASSPTKVAPQAEPLEILGSVEVDRMHVSDQVVTAPAGVGRVAHLTIDPPMQRLADASLKSRSIPYGAVVAMRVRTGEILAVASRRGGSKDDPVVSGAFPATDVFKLVTAKALLDEFGVTASTPVCYRDTGKKLGLAELAEDTNKDTWCPSLAEAMGRNLDAPFARLALRHLDKERLERASLAFGLGADLSFDVPVATGRVSIPDTALGFVEAAIGVGQVTMSAMHGLLMASAVANKGTMVRPVLVRKVEASGGKVVYRVPDGPRVERLVMTPAVAEELSKMMSETTEIGEGFRAFHDDTGHPVLGDTKVAGVTGAERVEQDAEQTTWFVGFAPVDDPDVVIATVVRNRRGASGNAQALAVDVLRGYVQFARQPDQKPIRSSEFRSDELDATRLAAAPLRMATGTR